MQPRMKNPAQVLPKATEAIGALVAATQQSGLPWKTLHLIHLRVSQINACGYCVDSGARHAKHSGETDERLFAVAAWRDTPFFSEAERAALALAECATRLSDRADPVPDEVWNEAARHYDETQLSGLLLWIATVNVFNRLNVPTRLMAGTPMPWDA
jgi:AhpD family alkylhydroperoxidase